MRKLMSWRMQYVANLLRPISVERRDLRRRLRAQRDPRLEQPDLQINMFGWSAFERLLGAICRIRSPPS